MTESKAVPADAVTPPVAHDPAFPTLHPRPDVGWLNDPNGLCRIDGRWHVFFQWNPDSARSSRIRWGHLSSTDLVHWTTEPAALVPRDGEPDSFGCWTGCVTDDGGTPTAVYSGVVDDSGHSVVLLARGDRELRDWQQDTEPVLAMPDPSRFSDARDPYVFHHGGHRWAVLGAGHRQGEPAALVYRVDDLTDWRSAGVLLDTADPVAASVAAAHVWECPNLFELDGRWVLIVSLMGPLDEDCNKVRYLVGDLEILDPDGPDSEFQLRFRPTTGGLLDTGPACYAPQVLCTPERVLLWGWAWELRDQGEVDAAGWAGSLTLPRELELNGDRLVSRPVAELEAVLGAELPIEASVTRHSFLIRFDGPGSLSADDEQVLVIDGPTDVWVDGSIVEAYPAGGIPHTTRGYPQTGWIVGGSASVVEIDL